MKEKAIELFECSFVFDKNGKLLELNSDEMFSVINSINGSEEETDIAIFTKKEFSSLPKDYFVKNCPYYKNL